VRTSFPLEAELERCLPGAVAVVPSSVLSELEGLADRKTRHAAGAREFAGRFRSMKAPGTGDDAIVRLATCERAAVATADRELEDRLLRRGIVVLVPRDRHRLERHGPRGPPAARASPRAANR